MNKKKLLYKSFEQKLSEKEKKKLDKLLSESESLRNEQNEILEMREGLFHINVSGFKPEFENEIIEKMNSSKFSRKIYFEQLEYSFKKIAFAVIVIIILALGYNYQRYGSLDLQGILGIEKVKMGDALNINELYSFDNNLGDNNGL